MRLQNENEDTRMKGNGPRIYWYLSTKLHGVIYRQNLSPVSVVTAAVHKSDRLHKFVIYLMTLRAGIAQ
jgi:major membrane immunogen (membrane-anchored lipoprotein)